MLKLTDSGYGFIGEVLRTPENAPYLKTFALTNISWNEETRAFYDQNTPDVRAVVWVYTWSRTSSRLQRT